MRIVANCCDCCCQSCGSNPTDANVGKQTIPCYRLSRRERDNDGNANLKRERVIIALPSLAIAVAMFFQKFVVS